MGLAGAVLVAAAPGRPVQPVRYSATHPLSAKLASFQVSRLDWVTAIVFVSAFATVGALLAGKAGESGG